MLHRYTTYIISLLIFVLSFHETKGQADRWYLLKSIQPLTDVEVKNIVASVTEQSGITEMWFNGAKTGTFGVKHDGEIFWPDIVHTLNTHGFYLAEITRGELHHHEADARTSIFFQEALYYSNHSEEIPQDFIATLNQEEWDGLTDEARNFYIESANFIIVDK